VVFDILKLGTMIVNAENNGAVFTTVNDNRITWVSLEKTKDR
jgi:lipopolysaccharide/colanic/teichoic acid biosynthesis glycosyltransferase